MKKIQGILGHILGAIAVMMTSAAATAQYSLESLMPKSPTQIAPAEMPAPSDASAYQVLQRVAPTGKFLTGIEVAAFDTRATISRLNLNCSIEPMWTNDLINGDYTTLGGWMREGRLCILSETRAYGQVLDYRYLEFDPYSGQLLENRKIELRDPQTQFANYLPYYISACYNPDDDCLYGFTTGEGGNDICFFKAPEGKPENTEVILNRLAFSRACAAICYNPSDKKVYGINRENKLVTLDLATGMQTEVMQLSTQSAYVRTALTYLPERDALLYNLYDVKAKSSLWLLSASAKTETQIGTFTGSQTFQFLNEGDASKDPRAISMPILDETLFDSGAQSGSIYYFLPDSYFAGGKVEGELEWEAYLDGEFHASGTGMPGKRVKVSFTDLSLGKHEFKFLAKQGDLSSATHTYKTYIGFDTPLKPTNVTLLEDGSISWDAVTEGKNKGYIDIDNLEYSVRINGMEVGVTKEPSFYYQRDLSLPYTSYTASVVAKNGDVCSEEGVSKPIKYGAPWKLDIEIEPNAEQAAGFDTYDGGGDGYVWTYKEMSDGTRLFVAPGLVYSDRSDDILYLPPTDFSEKGAVYQVEVEATNASSSYTDLALSINLYKDINGAAPVSEIMPKTVLPNKTYTTYTRVFTVPEAGVYRIGLFNHAIIYQAGVRVKKMSIKKIKSEGSDIPMEVTDLAGTAAEKGALNATVTFTLPTISASGDPIESETQVKAVVQGVDTVEVSGTPGSIQSATVATVQGMNEITVTTYIGDNRGQVSTVSLFTGHDIPDGVSTFTGHVTEHNLSIKCEWTAPTGGENGYYVDIDNLEYYLMQYDPSAGWVPVKNLGKNVFEYEYQVPEGSTLATARFGIAPANEQGLSSTTAWLSDVLGTPYTLPMLEEFAGGNPTYSPMRILRPTPDYEASEWGMVKPSLVNPLMENESGFAAYGRSVAPYTYGMMMLPKFSTVGVEEAQASFDFWTGFNMADISILGEAYGMESPQLLTRVPSGEGWSRLTFTLPEWMQNQEWCTIYIDVLFPTDTSYCLYSRYEYKEKPTNVVRTESLGDAVVGTYAGGILIDGAEGRSVEVYTLDGSCIASIASASASERIAVASGLYIVKVGTSSVRIIL